MSEPTEWPPFPGTCPMLNKPCIGTECAAYKKHHDPGWGMTLPYAVRDLYPSRQISVPGYWEARCTVIGQSWYVGEE